MTPRPCAGLLGFLVPRPCPNAAVGDCAKCGRAVCEQHAEAETNGLLCRQCRTGSEFPVGLAAIAATAGLVPLFAMADLAAFDDLEGSGDDEELRQANMFADLS